MFLKLSLRNWLASFLLALPLPVIATELSLADYLRENLQTEHKFTDQYDAHVWLVSKSEPISRFIKNRNQQLELLTAIHSAAKQTELDVDLVLALIEVESGFDRFAVSRAGAQGLMQVMPFWKNEIGRPEDNLINVETNLYYGCYILKYYISRHPNNLVNALAAYNGSLGKTWYPERIFKALKHWQ